MKVAQLQQILRQSTGMTGAACRALAHIKRLENRPGQFHAPISNIAIDMLDGGNEFIEHCLEMKILLKAVRKPKTKTKKEAVHEKQTNPAA